MYEPGNWYSSTIFIDNGLIYRELGGRKRVSLSMGGGLAENN